MSTRWPPTLGVIGFDGGYRPAVALALNPIVPELPVFVEEPAAAGGACCNPVGADCTVTADETECTDMGWIYQGDGTLCDPNPCGGACCHADGGCADTRDIFCTDPTVEFLGNGTSCATSRCEGVCDCCVFGCPPNCTCEDGVTFDECQADCPAPPNSNFWLLQGTCTLNPCLDEFPSCESSGVGACCGCPDFPCFGLCADGVPPDVCADAGGTYYDTCSCIDICPDDGGNCFGGCPPPP